MIAPRLILVTDPAFGDDCLVRCVERAARVLPRGALCVQLRDKRRTRASLRMLAGRLRTVTRAVGAAFVLNGPADIARDAGADGVHLPSDGGPVRAARAVFPGAWVSVATHTDEEVRRAVEGGADAVLVSPVFASRPAGSGSVRKEGRGLEALRAARAIAGDVPTYALGGVGPGEARACRAAGAFGVAVIKALLASDSPARAARAIHDALAPRW
jgi:thiamine-phosphate pyrophosphorylase